MKGVLPQRLRLALWNLRYRLSAEGRALHAAQPSRLERRRAKTELERRAAELDDAERPVGTDRLDRIWVINLASRTDRIEQVRAEFGRLGIDRMERFDAIPHEVGILGCTMSHLACLRRGLESSRGAVMICEDDVRFCVDRVELDALVDAFLDDPDADVAMLGYAFARSAPHDRLFLRGFGVRSASCYVVKDHVAPELIEIWEAGAAALARGESRRRFANDKAWFPLQERRVFVVPIVRAARQASGYSDVERRVVVYDH